MLASTFWRLREWAGTILCVIHSVRTQLRELDGMVGYKMVWFEFV